MNPQTNIAWTVVTALAIVLSCHQWIQYADSMPVEGISTASIQTNKPPLLTPFHAAYVESPPGCTNFQTVRELIGHPTIIKDAGLKGKISFQVLVDKRGHYLHHELEGEAHPLFQGFSEPFVPFLRFTPAKVEDKPVNCWTRVVFQF